MILLISPTRIKCNESHVLLPPYGAGARSYSFPAKVSVEPTQERPAPAASARAAFLNLSDDGTHVPSVLGERRVSCWLFVNRDITQAHSNSATSVYELPSQQGSFSTTPHTMAHIARIVPPRCRSENSWLGAGRVWICRRPLQPAAVLVPLVGAWYDYYCCCCCSCCGRVSYCK